MGTATRAGTAASPSGEVAEVWALLQTLFGQQRRAFLIAASELDLHPAQAGALMNLASPLSMRELADALVCDSSNVTGLVDRLEARGLVARQLTPEDRRVKQVVLTDAGRRVREQLVDQVGQPPAGFERLSGSELRDLRDLLARALADGA
jgi:DNA-binding MarR family transcriptional regulator